MNAMEALLQSLQDSVETSDGRVGSSWARIFRYSSSSSGLGRRSEAMSQTRMLG